jgi:hypothetical protein
MISVHLATPFPLASGGNLKDNDGRGLEDEPVPEVKP